MSRARISLSEKLERVEIQLAKQKQAKIKIEGRIKSLSSEKAKLEKDVMLQEFSKTAKVLKGSGVDIINVMKALQSGDSDLLDEVNKKLIPLEEKETNEESISIVEKDNTLDEIEISNINIFDGLNEHMGE